MFVFVPKSDDEINNMQNRSLLVNGTYGFVVKELKISMSQSGNEMLEVLLGVVDHDGQERNIRDYLMATDKMIFKLKHFCESIGLLDDYTKGTISPAKCIGRCGKLIIGTQKGSAKKDGSGYYADKNNVRDYVKHEVAEKKEPFNDDINF